MNCQDLILTVMLVDYLLVMDSRKVVVGIDCLQQEQEQALQDGEAGNITVGISHLEQTDTTLIKLVQVDLTVS